MQLKATCGTKVPIPSMWESTTSGLDEKEASFTTVWMTCFKRCKSCHASKQLRQLETIYSWQLWWKVWFRSILDLTSEFEELVLAATTDKARCIGISNDHQSGHFTQRSSTWNTILHLQRPSKYLESLIWFWQHVWINSHRTIGYHREELNTNHFAWAQHAAQRVQCMAWCFQLEWLNFELRNPVISRL